MITTACWAHCKWQGGPQLAWGRWNSVISLWERSMHSTCSPCWACYGLGSEDSPSPLSVPLACRHFSSCLTTLLQQNKLERPGVGCFGQLGGMFACGGAASNSHCWKPPLFVGEVAAPRVKQLTVGLTYLMAGRVYSLGRCNPLPNCCSAPAPHHPPWQAPATASS